MRPVLVVLFVMMTVAGHADESWPSFGNPFAFTEQGGEAIYRSVCAGCHMQDGRGATAAGAYPSLEQDRRLADFAYPIGMVLNGQKAMPPLGRLLTNEQIAAVVAYIRTHFGNGFTDAPTSADVAAGR